MKTNREEFRYRGVNLGSWLNIEDFMMGLEGTDWQIRRALARHLGNDRASAIIDEYQSRFVTESDIRRIAELGFDSVRVPFTYRQFESDRRPFAYRAESFVLLDRLFSWCQFHGLVVLLDFHAAPLGQNTTPPADSPIGYSMLWSWSQAQDRVVALWEELARRYGNHPALLGYDLLNEPMTNQPGELAPDAQREQYNSLCRRLVSAIRGIDREHWIVIESPVRESGGVAELDRSLFEDERTCVSFHHYPLFENSITPGGDGLPESSDIAEHTEFLRTRIVAEREFAEAVGRPMLLGEFGLSARWEQSRAQAIFAAQLATAEELGWSWMLWTWKDVWRLGLVTPDERSPWFEFTRASRIREQIDQKNTALSQWFTQEIRKDGALGGATPQVIDAAWNDLQRGVNRLFLDLQARQLAERGEVIANLPDAFDLDKCVLRENMYRYMKPYLR